MEKSFWAFHEGGRRWGHTEIQTGTLTHVHPLGMFWQRTEESSLTIATLQATVSIEKTHYPQLTAFSLHSQSKGDHPFTDCALYMIYFELVRSCAVSIGLRVDFGRGIEDSTKKKKKKS